MSPVTYSIRHRAHIAHKVCCASFCLKNSWHVAHGRQLYSLSYTEREKQQQQHGLFIPILIIIKAMTFKLLQPGRASL